MIRPTGRENASDAGRGARAGRGGGARLLVAAGAAIAAIAVAGGLLLAARGAASRPPAPSTVAAEGEATPPASTAASSATSAAPLPASTTLPAGPLTPERFETLSGLHFGFRPADVAESELAHLPQSFPDGQPGDMTFYEPTGGFRDEIGLVTKSEARWAITLDPRAEANMIANARSSKWFPIHLQDPAHGGGPVRFDLNPYKSLASSTKGDLAVTPDPVGNPKITVDPAHEPLFLYFYALLMRERGNQAEFRWAVDEMKYWCAWNYMKMTDNGRGFAKGIFNPVATQPRAAAWSLAALFQLYHVLPRDDPWYPSVKHSVEQNILFLDGNFRAGTYDNAAFQPYYDPPTGSLKNALGLMQKADSAYGQGPDGKMVMIGAFQAAYLAQVVLFGSRLDLDLDAPAKAAFRDLSLFVARWPVLLFGPANTAGAYDWRRAGEYSMAVGTLKPDGLPDYFADGGQVYAANYGHLPPLPDDRVFRYHDENKAAEGIAGGFIDNIVPALSMAVDLGAPGAAEGYARAASSTQWSSGGSYQFGILPHGKYFRAARPHETTRPAR